jgi:hypothetical protein
VEQEMKLPIIFAAIVALSGCATTSDGPRDVCAEKATFTPYRIDTPQRPKFNDTSMAKTNGEFVRMLEANMLNLISYSEQLENLLIALPKNLSVPDK